MFRIEIKLVSRKKLSLSRNDIWVNIIFKSGRFVIFSKDLSGMVLLSSLENHFRLAPSINTGLESRSINGRQENEIFK